MWQQLMEVINHHQRFILSTHLLPDGDGLGSETALYHFLRSLGKDVLIVNNDPLPLKYDFLDPHGVMVTFRGQSTLRDLLDFEVLIVLDNSFKHRLGQAAALVDLANVICVSIDHHAFHGELGSIRILDQKASSIGEMVYNLIIAMGGKITKAMAVGLYTSLVTDTHHFSSESTTERTFELARELVQCGVNPGDIHDAIYERNNLSQTRLLGDMLRTTGKELNGRLAYGYIDYDMFQKAAVGPEDTDYFPDFLSSLEGVDIAVLFKEIEPQVISVSLRSKGKINVGLIASDFGGGGHNDMAGMLLTCQLDVGIEQVLDAFRRAIERGTEPETSFS